MLFALDREGRMAGNMESGFWSRLAGRFAGPMNGGSVSQDGPRRDIVSPLRVSFRDGKLFTMQVLERCRITCTKGTVWVTPQDRSCDYILRAGESLVLRRNGKILVSGSAKEDSSIEVVYFHAARRRDLIESPRDCLA